MLLLHNMAGPRWPEKGGNSTRTSSEVERLDLSTTRDQLRDSEAITCEVVRVRAHALERNGMGMSAGKCYLSPIGTGQGYPSPFGLGNRTWPKAS